MSKIPAEAFDLYVAMGHERSYRAIGEKYGVSKRAVVKHAAREDWMPRLARIEDEARERSDERLTETLEQMRTRHLKTLRVLHSKAIQALKAHPLNSAMEAAKVAELVIKLERLVVGEVSTRAHLAVEETTRREIESLVIVEDQDVEAG